MSVTLTPCIKECAAAGPSTHSRGCHNDGKYRVKDLIVYLLSDAQWLTDHDHLNKGTYEILAADALNNLYQEYQNARDAAVEVAARAVKTEVHNAVFNITKNMDTAIDVARLVTEKLRGDGSFFFTDPQMSKVIKDHVRDLDVSMSLLALAHTGFGYDLKKEDKERLIEAAGIIYPSSVEKIICKICSASVYHGDKMRHDRILHSHG